MKIGNVRRTKILNPAIHYVLRVWKLNALLTDTDTDFTMVKNYFKEANDIGNELREFFASHGFPSHTIPRLNNAVTYAAVRALRPEVVIETGVAEGVSSYFILNALEKNRKGSLYSIDLPPEIGIVSVSPGKEIGWIVPEELKRRWTLILQDAKESLPKLLLNFRKIDVFRHDSNHGYEHMLFELRTSWKYLKSTGFLLVDDIDLNKAFVDFIKEVNVRQYAVFSNLGVIKKREDV